MDPTACWKRILDAINYGGRQDVAEVCDDLEQWLRNGGFMPTICSDDLELLLHAISDWQRK